MAVQLPYTLQTSLGMVMNNGAPKERTIPSKVTDLRLSENNEIVRTARYKVDPLSSVLPEVHFQKCRHGYQADQVITDRAAKYIANCDAYETCDPATYTDRRVRHFAANLAACSRTVTKEDLKSWIHSRSRFDLEQAAALVVAAHRTSGRVDDAVRLIKQLGSVLATSCMWLDPNAPVPKSQGAMVSPKKLARMLQLAAAAQGQEIPWATSYSELLILLMRVRRRKPNNRCLHLPEWLFEGTSTTPPAHFKAFFTNADQTPQAPSPGDHPTAPREADSIMLSRKHFRGIQRRIFRLYQFWKPSIVLRKSIKGLEDNVLFASSWFEERVFATHDVALISHYFFHFQRRLQRKVVSDNWWSGFLAKGGSGKLYQNNLKWKSTFENALLSISESNDEGVIVAMGNENTMALIDQTCLLMREYVVTYGGGKTSNLVFKMGVRGGGTRGPVDEYNLLCDILSELRKRAKEEGVKHVPGPVHKFLAKDIMSYNDSWEDDAFAGGKRAGWEDWIEKRGLVADKEEDDWESVSFKEGLDDEKSFPALVIR